jgi:hypothetical protein
VPPSNLGRTRHRPARVLIGWMDPERAIKLLAANNLRPDLATGAINSARAAASLREVPACSVATVRLPTPELAEYLQEFHGRPAAQPYLAEGWKPQLIDLRGVRAFQPVVFIDRLPVTCTFRGPCRLGNNYTANSNCIDEVALPIHSP